MSKKTWGDNGNLALEVWKYYQGIGGADKDRMIQIVTWLLGFSAAIIGFYASGKLTEQLATVLLIVIGIFVSLLAAYVALLYGSYAAWNWSIANQIAHDYKWDEQKTNFNPFLRWASYEITNTCLENLKSKEVPDDVLYKLKSIKKKEYEEEENFLEALNKTIGDEQTEKYKSLLLEHALRLTIARWIPFRLAKPCEEKIAPVFWIFFGISLLSFIIHMILLLQEFCVEFGFRLCQVFEV